MYNIEELQVQLQFYNKDKDNTVYTPLDINNLMDLYNELEIGCEGCKQPLNNWYAQDVYQDRKEWTNNNDAIIIGTDNNPHFIIFDCINDKCTHGTNIEKLNLELKQLIDKAGGELINTDGLSRPYSDFSVLGIHEMLEGNYRLITLNEHTTMIVNDIKHDDLPYNKIASELYVKYYNKKIRINGNVILHHNYKNSDK